MRPEWTLVAFVLLSLAASALLGRQLGHPRGWLGRRIGPLLDQGNRRMLETALEELAPRPGERIADVGFGGGLTLERIRERSAPARPVGMEISLAMVEAARRRWGNAMELFQADVASIPLADSSLDALLTVNTIYFWKEPERALGEIRRVLKPGGRLVLGIRRPWTMRIAPMTWFGFRLYSVGEATAMLEKTGFSVTVTEKVKGEVFLTGRA